MLLVYRQSSRTAGFSLGEVLVALAIAAMMSAALSRFYASTRANAAKIAEALEMTTLGETLLTRLSSLDNLKPGRTDGRSGTFSWHVEVIPTAFTATARQMSPKQPPAAPADDKNKSKMLSTMSLSTFSPETSFGVAAAKPQATVEWISYRVAVVIEAPTGRKHAVDTIRIGQAESAQR